MMINWMAIWTATNNVTCDLLGCSINYLHQMNTLIIIYIWRQVVGQHSSSVPGALSLLLIFRFLWYWCPGKYRDNFPWFSNMNFSSVKLHQMHFFTIEITIQLNCTNNDSLSVFSVETKYNMMWHDVKWLGNGISEGRQQHFSDECLVYLFVVRKHPVQLDELRYSKMNLLTEIYICKIKWENHLSPIRRTHPTTLNLMCVFLFLGVRGWQIRGILQSINTYRIRTYPVKTVPPPYPSTPHSTDTAI